MACSRRRNEMKAESENINNGAKICAAGRHVRRNMASEGISEESEDRRENEEEKRNVKRRRENIEMYSGQYQVHGI